MLGFFPIFLMELCDGGSNGSVNLTLFLCIGMYSVFRIYLERVSPIEGVVRHDQIVHNIYTLD